MRNIQRETPIPKPEPPPEDPAPKAESGRTVVANYPHHVWHVDATVVPTTGLWVPWQPCCQPLYWPFVWHVVAILDQHSRAVMAIGAFDKSPTRDEVTKLFEQAIRAAGRTPKYIISDQGVQFQEAFGLWCEGQGIQHRRGEIGRHGSIAVIERVFRTLKKELLAVVEATTEQWKMNGCWARTSGGTTRIACIRESPARCRSSGWLSTVWCRSPRRCVRLERHGSARVSFDGQPLAPVPVPQVR